MKKPQIKHINFEIVSRIASDFVGRVGLVDLDNRKIWIDNQLPKTSDGTRSLVLAHEKAHLRVHEHSVKFKSKLNLETYCWLEAICSTQKKYLSAGECFLKDMLVRGRGKRLDWSRRLERAEIIETILGLIGESSINTYKLCGLTEVITRMK